MITVTRIATSNVISCWKSRPATRSTAARITARYATGNCE
jgi:hypothetical protein